MASFNQVILLGNLTRDPQLRYLPSQTAVVDFGLATNRRWKTPTGEDREEVCFVDCSAFARQAEVINQYCRKGNPLFIQGRLKFDQWEDKQGGGKRSKLSVVVESFQLLGGRPQGQDNAAPSPNEGGMIPPQARPPQGRPAAQRPAGAPPGAAPAAAAGAAPAAPPPDQPFPEEPQFKENDIPF
jgi:single-strand DNA-binding protein